MIKVAFDFGGVLSLGGQVVELFHALKAANCDIHIITTVGSEEEGNRRVGDLKNVGVDVGLDKLHIILDSHPDYHSRYKSHGEAKVAIMKKIGCSMLFDDAENVISAVANAGLIGFRVYAK